MKMNREKLLAQLAQLINDIQCPHPLRVAVDGTDAAGKSTLADELASALRDLGRPVIQSTVDGFHNPRSIRYRRGPNSPEGYFHDSFDYLAVTSCLLFPLGSRGDRRYRTAVFDYRTDQVVEAPVLMAPDDAILVFDGIFLQRPELARYWDLSIYIDVAVESALERAENRYIARNGHKDPSDAIQDLRERYMIRYNPAQREYRSSCRPDDVADLLIDNNDLSKPAILRSNI